MTTSIGVKERPIPFRPDMVRAILAGRKTQTRRVIDERQRIGYPNSEIQFGCDEYFTTTGKLSFGWKCPYGASGDRLWVREQLTHEVSGTWLYSADNQPVMVRPDYRSAMISWAHHKTQNYCPPMFMPHWASRILLEITDVRAQRLQDISEEDAIAEGLPVQMGDGTGAGPGYKWNGPGYHDLVSKDKFGARTFHVATGRHGEYCSCRDGASLKLTPARCAYRILWQSINAKRTGGIYAWDKNPWVWAITFKESA